MVIAFKKRIKLTSRTAARNAMDWNSPKRPYIVMYSLEEKSSISVDSPEPAHCDSHSLDPISNPCKKKFKLFTLFDANHFIK
jgi:hypothetical protein